MTGWNPYYIAYAREHDRSPEAMLAHDGERCPGGRMAEFIIWCQRRWAEWRKLHGRQRDDILSEQDHRDFAAWLAAGGR